MVEAAAAVVVKAVVVAAAAAAAAGEEEERSLIKEKPEAETRRKQMSQPFTFSRILSRTALREAEEDQDREAEDARCEDWAWSQDCGMRGGDGGDRGRE